MFYLRFPTEEKIRFSTAGHFIAQEHPIHPHRILGSAVLLLGLSGTYPIAQDGREYLLGEGTFMLLFPQHEHMGTAPASDGQSHFWCHFYLPTPAVHTVSDKLNLLSADNHGFCILPEFGKLAHMEKYHLLFRQLIDASQNTYSDPAAREAVCGAYTSILLHELSQECIAGANLQQQSGGAKQRAVVARVKEYLRADACSRELSVVRIAQSFHYNPSYLTQIFREETGMTLVGYINSVRMEEAQKLLLNTDLHIDKIAAAVGFRDEKYFMKTFRRLCGVTPSAYRQSYYRLHVNTR